MDALREFRARLPATFAEAFPDKPDASSTPYVMWGVTINPIKARGRQSKRYSHEISTGKEPECGRSKSYARL
ncbi:hypothetical protein EDD16DRAFT_1100114 [Pisolithus croceorrhizus]|nr:hypothetical protein EDD16DRAFT_1100114 [Pisolithus croceorrhizus]